jgi:chromosome segregation ATPase
MNCDLGSYPGIWKGIVMKRANGVDLFSLFHRIIGLGVLSLFLLSVTGCNERLKRMESNQVVLEEKVDQNSRQTLLLARKLDMSQAMLEGRIERVQEGNNVSMAEARATRYEQEKLREETRQFSQKWFAGITRVEEHQRVLQESVNGVAGTATVIDEGVQKLDGGQETMQQTMAANQTQTQAGFARIQQEQGDLRAAASEAFASLERGQTGILTMTAQGVDATHGVAEQVTGVQKSQADQTNLIQSNYTMLLAKVDDVTANQKQLQRSTNQQAQRLSRDITAVQTDLQQANETQKALVTQRADAIDAGLNTALQNQVGLSNQIKGHHDMAVDTGEHVKAIEAEQKRINDAMQQGNRTVDSAVKAVGQGQEKLHETMKNVEATAVATKKQTESMASGQSEFYQLEDQRHDTVVRSLSGLESAQQATQDTVVQIQGTTQGVAEDTDAIRGQQSRLAQGLQQEGAQIRQGLVQLENKQDQLQQSVNQVQETANTIKRNTEDTAGQTRSMRDQQAALQQDIAREGAQIGQTLATLEKNQDQTYRAVNNVQVTSNTVASNTTTLMEQQAALQRVTHQNQDQLVNSLDLMGGQQQALSQKADDLRQGQDEIKNMVTQSQSAVGGKIDAVSSQQTGLKDGLTAQKNTSQDIASQIQALQMDQTKISQAIDQRQKAWSGQTQALAERAAELEKSLGQVDDNVSSLQTNLVSQITELTLVLKSLQAQDGARRAQLAEDMKAFSDTLKQIQTAQMTLAARVEQVDAYQKQQSREFLSALEKSKKETDKNATVLPAETEVKEVEVVK